MKLLIIDDEATLRRSLRLVLEAMGHHVTEARDGEQARDILSHRFFDAAILDLRLGGEGGLELLPGLLRLAAGMPVVVMTAYATVDSAVEAMRRGAFDYLPKPFTPDQVRASTRRALEGVRLRQRLADAELRLQQAGADDDLFET